MASSPFFVSLCPLFIMASVMSLKDDAVVFEEGYSVTTVWDGNKASINPYWVLPRPGSPDLMVLDSKGTAFYVVSFTTSQAQGGAINQVAGDGAAGFRDGEAHSASFSKAKNFAFDRKGNVYVSDNGNGAIRKISNSGVTTIAGGYSRTPGRADGPGQNATFSSDFVLSFATERCALIISDHGNRLVRQINLKAEDCAEGSQSGGLGTPIAWAMGLVVSCLLGLIIGFAVRPYIFPHEGSSPLLNVTWKHCLISLERQVLMLCFGIRSVVVRSTPYIFLRRLVMLSFSHLSLMFRINIVEPQTFRGETVSLLDYDEPTSSNITKLKSFTEQLKDLVSMDQDPKPSDATDKALIEQDCQRAGALSESEEKIDSMIRANIMCFAELAEGDSPLEPCRVSSSGLVRRR